MQAGLSFFSLWLKGGKSGQQRASYFLTGRALALGEGTDSATENKLPQPDLSGRGKGEKAG